MKTESEAPPRTGVRAVDPRLLRYSPGTRACLGATAAITLAQTGVTVAFAWLLTHALVGAIGGAPVAELLPGLGVALILVVVRGVLVVLLERVSAQGAARASLQLREALVRAIERLGPGWLAQRSAASLAVTAGHGLESLDAYFGRYLPQLVATVITTPLLIVVMLIADPLSGLIVILTLPLIPLFMVLIGMATRAVQRRQYRTLERLAARFADTVNGLGTLKIFGRQHRAADSIESVTRQYKRETMSVLRVSFLSGFALEFLASISVAIIAVTIGFRLLAGDMGLETGLFVLLLAPEAYLPLRQVGVHFHAAAEGVAATDEIVEILETAPSSQAATRPPREDAAAPASPIRLEVRGLRVRRGERVVGPLDLRVGLGEIVLLEGPSGAGKSSVLAALLGFADCEGEILVGGAPSEHARTAIAWAGQRPGLLSGTVAENVALGDPRPDAELVAECLAAAQAADIPPDLGLGAAGSGLSGGQAQRVAIARAFYRLRSGHACVLALDEPAAALDAATEAGLWTALRGEADAGAGVLLVSHRTGARAIADRIVRLELAEATP